MDKNKFSNLIQHPQPLSEGDLEDLNQIIKSHPYCQVPYFLIAKHYYQNNLPEKDKYIHLASAYTLDRRTLKRFITESFALKDSQKIPASDQNEVMVITEEEKYLTTEDVSEKTPDQEIQIEKRDVSEELISETSQNTEEVKVNLNEFTPSEENIKEESSRDEASEPIEDETVEIKNHISQDRNTFRENTKKALASEEQETKIGEPEDSFIQGYLSNLKSDPDQTPNYKRKHQDDLIERFIKSRPSLARPSNGAQKENTEDLSEPSITIDANLISENLAIIMVKQGKVEKAIDIYKKLIWKYPQKKAYFANRIQELKK